MTTYINCSECGLRTRGCDCIAANLADFSRSVERMHMLLVEASGYIRATDEDGEYAEAFEKKIRRALPGNSNDNKEK